MWFVYMLVCSDKKKSLYVGITNNLEKRIKAHNDGKGAKFTKGRGPVSLLHSFKVKNKSKALKLEYKIKQMSRIDKLRLLHKNM